MAGWRTLAFLKEEDVKSALTFISKCKYLPKITKMRNKRSSLLVRCVGFYKVSAKFNTVFNIRFLYPHLCICLKWVHWNVSVKRPCTNPNLPTSGEKKVILVNRNIIETPPQNADYLRWINNSNSILTHWLNPKKQFLFIQLITLIFYFMKKILKWW